MTDRSNTPWYNEEVLEAKREKRKAERRYLKSKLTVHLDMLKEARSKVNDLCKRAKSDYYKAKIEDCAKDQKALFKFTNGLMHRTREAALPVFEDPSVLADDFATFFTEKIERINQTFTSTDSNEERNHTNATCEINQFQTISQAELKKVILSGNSKSCLLDPIPTSVLKECIDTILPTLTNIVN